MSFEKVSTLRVAMLTDLLEHVGVGSFKDMPRPKLRAWPPGLRVLPPPDDRGIIPQQHAKTHKASMNSIRKKKSKNMQSPDIESQKCILSGIPLPEIHSSNGIAKMKAVKTWAKGADWLILRIATVNQGMKAKLKNEIMPISQAVSIKARKTTPSHREIQKSQVLIANSTVVLRKNSICEDTPSNSDQQF